MRGAAGGCGGGGRRAARALLRLSDRGAAPESRAPGCGWEEAVQGWGSTNPLACFQLQKQIKKSKASETSNNCLLCLDMVQATDKCSGQEVKTTRNQSKAESKLNTEAAADTAPEEISAHSSKRLEQRYYFHCHQVQTSRGLIPENTLSNPGARKKVCLS
eukprot:XP_027322574.1 uncharacterized protein C16orf46 homolog isoform X3 [Anas platyrhynchos]